MQKPLDSEKDAWRDYRIDGPYEDEHPVLAFYCAECAEREFGLSLRPIARRATIDEQLPGYGRREVTPCIVAGLLECSVSPESLEFLRSLGGLGLFPARFASPAARVIAGLGADCSGRIERFRRRMRASDGPVAGTVRGLVPAGAGGELTGVA